MSNRVSPRYLFPLEVWDGGATELVGDPLQYGPLDDFEPTGWEERKGFAELETAVQKGGGEYEIKGTEIISGNDGTEEIIGDDGMNEIVGDDGTDEIVGFDPQTLALLGLGGLAAYMFLQHEHPSGGTSTVVVPSAVPGGPAEAVSVPQQIEAPPGDGGGGGGGDGGGGGGGGGFSPPPPSAASAPAPAAPPSSTPAAVAVAPGTSAQAAIQAISALRGGTQIQVPAGAIPGVPAFTATDATQAMRFIAQQTTTNDVQALRSIIQMNGIVSGGLNQLLQKLITPEEAAARNKAPALMMQAVAAQAKAAGLTKQGKTTEAAAAAKLSADLKAQAEALTTQWKTSFLSRTANMTTAGYRFKSAGESVLRPVARVSGNVLVPVAKLPVAVVSGALGTATHIVGNVFDVLSNALRGRF